MKSENKKLHTCWYCYISTYFIFFSFY